MWKAQVNAPVTGVCWLLLVLLSAPVVGCTGGRPAGISPRDADTTTASSAATETHGPAEATARTTGVTTTTGGTTTTGTVTTTGPTATTGVTTTGAITTTGAVATTGATATTGVTTTMNATTTRATTATGVTTTTATGVTTTTTAKTTTGATTSTAAVSALCSLAYGCCSGLDQSAQTSIDFGKVCANLLVADQATCVTWLDEAARKGLCGASTGTGVTTQTKSVVISSTATATASKTFTGGPCDIYAADGGPCVAAHSTVRALSRTYSGPLYQVTRSDGSTRDIGALAPGGFAKSADQDDFCGDSSCTISIIYDQSGRGNHLTPAPAGGAKPTPGKPANAKALPSFVSGHKVYGEHNPAGVAYRNSGALGTATGDNPQTIYMIAGGTYYNGGCCFEYGNVETNSRDNGEGAAEAVYFGSCTIWGKGADTGPWVMGDLENGLWAGDTSPYQANRPVNHKYVTAMVKGAAGNHWVIKVGDSQSGVLQKPFEGKRPSSRYVPMRKEGAITLGAAGDNSNGGQGDFFEGVMTAHFSSDAADDAVQANIVAAGYGM